MRHDRSASSLRHPAGALKLRAFHLRPVHPRTHQWILYRPTANLKLVIAEPVLPGLFADRFTNQAKFLASLFVFSHRFERAVVYWVIQRPARIGGEFKNRWPQRAS